MDTLRAYLNFLFSFFMAQLIKANIAFLSHLPQFITFNNVIL